MILVLLLASGSFLLTAEATSPVHVPVGCGDDPNAVPGCGNYCGNTCEGYNATGPIACSQACRLGGCDCRKGYVYDRSFKKCVKPSDCSCNGDRNARPGCSNWCGKSCTDYNSPPKPCPFFCLANGCQCKVGYVHDDSQNRCVLPADCPRSCPAGEIYKVCGTACPATCANYGQSHSCPAKCVAGCYCPEGQVRDSNGTCIDPKDCVPTCGENEWYDSCVNGTNPCPPQSCSRLWSKFDCRNFPKECTPQCRCKGLFLWKGNKCVPPHQCITPDCPQNERYEWDSNNCQLSCGDNGDIMGACAPNSTCFCNEGYVRDKQNACIKKEDCPSPVCGRNEIASKCKIIYPPQSCESIYTTYMYMDPQPCEPGCDCVSGYLRNQEGVCVPSDQCSIPTATDCPLNEHYESNSNNCQLSCGDNGALMGACMYSSACFCNEGYIRDKEGTCIPNDFCPPTTQCNPENFEVFLECGTACPDTCENYGKPRGCTFQCVPGCYCKQGLVRRSDGKCIKPEECLPTCGENEWYDSCVNGTNPCPPQSCSRLWSKFDCRNFPKECTPQCRCKGLLLWKGNECVPANQCITPDCPPNEHYEWDSNNCQLSCGDNGDIMGACAPNSTCFCNEGYLRDNQNACIKKEDCPSLVCGPNEKASKCKITCPPQSCESIYTLYLCVDPQPCETGCDCVSGYLRNREGVCVPGDQCFPPTPVCGENEIYNSCGTACQRTCRNKDLLFNCIADCKEGCFCIDGYVRNDNGDCVRPDRCPNQCQKPNEVFLECGSSCPITCSNFVHTTSICTQQCVQGCFCAKGYVRRADGECVRPDQCSPVHKCRKPNEVFLECGSSCPNTCSNYKDTDRICTQQCVQGCFCAKGYVRRADGECVRPDKCPTKPLCGENEITRDCKYICPPQTCESLYTDYQCELPQPCVPGCDCVPEYLRNSSGVCVPAEECTSNTPDCGVNEVYDSCGTACPRTCSNKDHDIVCTADCREGCFCKPGYVRNAADVCVTPDECPCPKNETYSECFHTCPPENCSAKGHIYDCPFQNSSNCQQGCRCLPGYLRDDNGQCVKVDDCPACASTERYVPCVAGYCIAKTCRDRSGPVPCPDIRGPCAGGCICQEGMLRNDNGVCVPEEQCPPLDCNGDPNAEPGCQDCKYTCTALMEPPRQQLQPCAFVAGCEDRCACKEGFYLDEDQGICVVAERCTPIKCTRKHEVYNSCPYPCYNDSCATKESPPVLCNLLIKDCQPRCVCEKGFWRNADGVCVPGDQCSPAKKCNKPNEVFLDCGPSCPDTCFNYKNNKRTCTQQCVQGCFCAKGYFRTADRECVWPDQCPCPKNETFNKCFWPCPPGTCDSIGKRYSCPAMSPTNCIKGCRCAPGYLKNESGMCIKKEECPCKTDPNAVYKEHPSACPATCTAPAPANCTKKSIRVGCECKKGYVLNNDTGMCVKPKQCPHPARCPPGEIYKECGPACPETCNSSDKPTACTDRCLTGCFCSDGQYRNADGKCIDCTTRCPKNEEYSSCFKKCPPRTCESIGRQYKCAPQNCSQGCVCLDGYSRDENGVCIPSMQCPKAGCASANETFSNCGHECSYCPVDDSPPTTCEPAQRPCRPGCVCARHYRRDRNHQCILGYECSPVRCTRPYEEYNPCPSACLAEWCGDKDNQPTTCNTLVEHVCDPRCVCRKGHFRDSEGICVPHRKCPPSPVCEPQPHSRDKRSRKPKHSQWRQTRQGIYLN